MTRREFSRTTKLATWERADGRCEECGRKLFPGERGEYDHRIPDALRKDNSPDNCVLLCGDCHSAKTKTDVRNIAKAKRVKAKHIGAHQSRHPLPGGRGSKWKKTIGGQVVPREE